VAFYRKKYWGADFSETYVEPLGRRVFWAPPPAEDRGALPQILRSQCTYFTTQDMCLIYNTEAPQLKFANVRVLVCSLCKVAIIGLLRNCYLVLGPLDVGKHLLVLLRADDGANVGPVRRLFFLKCFLCYNRHKEKKRKKTPLGVLFVASRSSVVVVVVVVVLKSRLVTRERTLARCVKKKKNLRGERVTGLDLCTELLKARKDSRRNAFVDDGPRRCRADLAVSPARI